MIKIIKPCKEYLESYHEACMESFGHVHDEYIMHNPSKYDEWKDKIFENYENCENGVDLPEGFLPSMTRWIVEDGRYIGTFNIRPQINYSLLQWGGTLGIVIRYGERGKGYSFRSIEALRRCEDVADYMIDDCIVITTEQSNVAGIGALKKCFTTEGEEEYTTKVGGVDSKVIRIRIKCEDFFIKCLDYEIKDINLASKGYKKIAYAMENMPVMNILDARFDYQKPLENHKVALCSHITKETAVACICLKNGGADVLMVSSNPRSTQDDVAASLVKDFGISVFGHSQQTNDEWVLFRQKIMEFEPDILLDDGAEILPMLYDERPDIAEKLIGTTEQTTSGVNKVKNMDEQGILKHPVIAVNSSEIKHLFDNHFGVGQTSLTSILQICNILMAAEVVVVIGYGPVGTGIASDMRGVGAHVIVCETDALRALQAYLDGFSVMNMDEAARIGSVFITATGSSDVIPIDTIMKMKSGAILSNCGSGQTEIDVQGIKQMAVSHEEIGLHIVKYNLPNGRNVKLLTDGRVTNLVGGEGNPPTIMDLTFASITLSVEYLIKNELENHMHVMPKEVDDAIAKIKLNEFGIKVNKPTEKQISYDKDWHK